MPDALLTELVAAPLDEFKDGASEWRREFVNGGRYWQWRRGSGKNRVSRYGGKAVDLFGQEPELKVVYERNKDKELRRREKRKTTSGSDHPSKRGTVDAQERTGIRTVGGPEG